MLQGDTSFTLIDGLLTKVFDLVETSPNNLPSLPQCILNRVRVVMSSWRAPTWSDRLRLYYHLHTITFAVACFPAG